VAPKIGGPWLKPFWPNGKSAPGSRLALVSMDWIRIGYPAGYLRFLDQDWIGVYVFEKNWIRTGSGYLFDFYNEIFL